ncbi:hypothetical protein QR680_016030 [Steinernema hermaphroditum]|uniref:Methyltransferase FkbM domain-containing protein n=1 Tax=Steinernema hermaphroditum TaxID=289476 RepID=A0AA39H9S7_9BILA|nr:hypothetical protein QR680_016030 [Steinernema hermaphroditum]
MSSRCFIILAACILITLTIYRPFILDQISSAEEINPLGGTVEAAIKTIVKTNFDPTANVGQKSDMNAAPESKAGPIIETKEEIKVEPKPEPKIDVNPKPKIDPSVDKKSLFDNHSTCIQNKINGLSADQIWTGLVEFVTDCEKLSGMNMSGFAPLQNDDETKYHLPAKSKIDKCLVLSLGVGLDTKSEQALHLVQPECHFVGADPTVQGNKELYEKIGAFHPYAIGNKNEVVESVIINGFDNRYRRENITTMEFVKFMKEHVKELFVDNLFLDAEYAEYGLMGYFLNGGQLDAAEIEICQVNIEIHLPSEQQKEEFANFLKKLLEEKRYAVFKVFKVEVWGHNRVVLINYGDNKCAERYLASKNGVLEL